jgi:hypothetical protein
MWARPTCILMPLPWIGTVRIIGADRDRADEHVIIVDVPAFLAGVFREAAGESRHADMIPPIGAAGKPLGVGTLDCRAYMISGGRNGANAMRSILTLGFLIALCASANAARGHLSKPRHLVVRPSQGVAAPTRFAVPGWTDEATRSWLDNASSGVGRGGWWLHGKCDSGQGLASRGPGFLRGYGG